MRNPNATYYLLYASKGVFGIIFFYNPFLHGVLLTGLRCTGRVFVEKLTPPGIFIPYPFWVVYGLIKSKRVVSDPY